MKINIKNKLIVDTEEIIALVPTFEKEFKEYQIWAKYEKFDTYIAWKTREERDAAFNELENAIRKESTKELVIIPGRLVISVDVFIAAAIDKKSQNKIKIVTDLVNPFNQILFGPPTGVTPEGYMEEIGNMVGV